MSDGHLPLGYIAIKDGRQYMRSLSFTVSAGGVGQVINSNYLRLISLQGQEQVSQPYEFTLVLRGNALNDVPIPQQTPDSDFADLPNLNKPTAPLPTIQGVADSLLAQWGRVKLGYSDHFKPDSPDDTYPVDAPDSYHHLPARYFSGIVSSVSLSGPGEYTVQLASPLLPLTLRNRYHVYKNLPIAGVIVELLAPELVRYGENFHVDVTGVSGLSASRTQDWLQAGETDYAMLQRLMNKAAIHFYFIHREDSLTLVFSNQPSHQQDVQVPGMADGTVRLRYSYTDIKELGRQQWDLFGNLSYKTQLTPNGVQSVLAHRESNWETNAVAKYTSYPVVDNAGDQTDYHFYKTFSYGVNQDESKESLDYIDQQIACQQTTLTGESTNYCLSPGYAFTLTQQAINPFIDSTDATLDPTGTLVGTDTNNSHPFTADELMPAQFDGRTFIVTKITHQVSEHTPYSGQVEATPLPTGHEKTATEVLITPFDIQDTQQGQVLATVVESAVPKSSYFFEKSDFSTEIAATSFGIADKTSKVSKDKQIGCVVQFATDEGTSINHWVALSDDSQTAPAVGSMVMIGRAGNESELPQIQQVLSSHGAKTIQPTLWNNNSWMFNTNWGSNCNTNYGDSLNIHFGSAATPDLKTAMNIVQSAYDNPTVLSAKFGGANYDMGCSFSYSTTSNGAKGLANASVSQGSHFSESHSEQDYNVSYTNCRQSYSKLNKSVDISYQGYFTDSIDENNLSFINGKIPNQKIIDICDALPDGSSYSESHIKGTSTTKSTFEGVKIEENSFIGLKTSTSSFLGGSLDINFVIGCQKTINCVNFEIDGMGGGNEEDEEDEEVEEKGQLTTHKVNGAQGTLHKINGKQSTTNKVKGAQTITNKITGVQETKNTIGGGQTTTHEVTGAQEEKNTIGGDQKITNEVKGAQQTKNTITGDQTITNEVKGAQQTKNTITGDQTTTSAVTGAQETKKTITGDQTINNEVTGAQETTNTITGDQKTTNTVTGAQETTNTITGDQTITDEVTGAYSRTTNVTGVGTITESVEGALSKSTEAAAISYSLQGVSSVSVVTMNITVDAVLSIM